MDPSWLLGTEKEGTARQRHDGAGGTEWGRGGELQVGAHSWWLGFCGRGGDTTGSTRPPLGIPGDRALAAAVPLAWRDRQV